MVLLGIESREYLHTIDNFSLFWRPSLWRKHISSPWLIKEASFYHEALSPSALIQYGVIIVNHLHFQFYFLLVIIHTELHLCYHFLCILKRLSIEVTSVWVVPHPLFHAISKLIDFFGLESFSMFCISHHHVLLISFSVYNFFLILSGLGSCLLKLLIPIECLFIDFISSCDFIFWVWFDESNCKRIFMRSVIFPTFIIKGEVMVSTLLWRFWTPWSLPMRALHKVRDFYPVPNPTFLHSLK